MKIKHYDLFAGIGGFSLALDTIFHEQKNEHIFCEWEAFPTAVLKKHWPDATYYGDIADLVADTDSQRRKRIGKQNEGRHGLFSGEASNQEQEMVILTGGFPCQPFSHAGRRAGTADDRYKWPDMFAVIQNVRPDWVIAENVRGLVTWSDGMVLETVCVDLESEGYEVQPLIIPAVSVGAPHRRDRVWIIAHAKDTNGGGELRNLFGEDAEKSESEEQHEDQSWELSDANWSRDWREVALATCHDGVDDGLPRRMDGATLRGKQTDTISASQHRKLRLKACGNAIVPQVAMEIFAAIKKSI